MSIETVLVLTCDVCHNNIERRDYCYKFGARFVCFSCLSHLASWLYFLGMKEMSEQIDNSRDGYPGGMEGIETVAVHSIIDDAR